LQPTIELYLVSKEAFHQRKICIYSQHTHTKTDRVANKDAILAGISNKS